MNGVIAQSQLITRAGDAHRDQPRSAHRLGDAPHHLLEHGRGLERSGKGRRVEGRADEQGETAAKPDAETTDAKSFATRLQRHERDAEGRTESVANADDAAAGDAVDAANPEGSPAIAAEEGDSEEGAGRATGSTNDGRARDIATADDDAAPVSEAEGEESEPAAPDGKHRSLSTTEPDARQANDGVSIEFSLASLGQSRPITIEHITQLLLQVDPTLAARGMVKGVKPLAAGAARELGGQNGIEPVGTGDEIRFGRSADWQGASTPEGVDAGEKILYSAAAHAGLDIDARIDAEIPIEAGLVQARPDATGNIAPRTPVGEGASRGRREIAAAASSSIWTLSVVPAAAAHVGAGMNQRSAAGPSDGVAGRVADLSQGATAAAAIVSGQKSGSASTDEQGKEDSTEARAKASQPIAGVPAQGDLSLPGENTAGRTAAGETHRGNEAVRQEVLAAQIDRALAASVERSVASPSNGASHETVLQLSPRVLGRIRIAVQVESNKASVRMRVENSEARQLLTDSLPSLVASLKQRGIEVESVQIRESEAESIAAEQPLRGAESSREAVGWNPKRLERSRANAARSGAETAETADVIVTLRLDALA